MKKFLLPFFAVVFAAVFLGNTSTATAQSAPVRGEDCTISPDDRSGRGNCSQNTRATWFCVGGKCQNPGDIGDACLPNINNRTSGTCGKGMCVPDPNDGTLKCTEKSEDIGDTCIESPDNPAGNCSPGDRGAPRFCVNGKCEFPANEGEACLARPNRPEGTCASNFLCENGLCKKKPPSNADPTLPPPPKPPCAVEGQLRCESFHTGFGRILTNPGGFISSVFGVLLALSGAIALLLIIRAGYRIMVSEGNPEKVKEGRDQLIAAIVGLLFLIFAFVFLQLIGVDILKIPGFGGVPAPESKRLPKGSTCISDSQDPSFLGQGNCEKDLICGDIDPSLCRDEGCQGTCK